MLNYDPVSDLRHWPLPMSKFGSNPYGGNLYRVVFGPSRRYLVCGEWPDGAVGGRWVQKYKQLGDCWVLERWRAALELCPEGKVYWDAELNTLGPWPEKGDFELVHAFETCSPSDANIEKLIQWSELGQRSTLAEKVAFHQREWDKERNAVREQARDLVRSKLPAFGHLPMFSRKVGRGTKEHQFKHTAEELGLPTSNGVMHASNKPHQAA